MSFWNLNDQSEKLDTTGSFTSNVDLEPIPNKTQVKAAIDEAKWDEYQSDEYISLRWTVLAPAEYKGRKIFQKVKVMEADAKKSDKAKKMLAAIASNAGGGLLKVAGKPTDMDLQKHLLNKPMVLLLAVWAIEDKETMEVKKGNWVSAVSPLVAKKVAEPDPAPAVVESDDDMGF